jgi:hypothetical protein
MLGVVALSLISSAIGLAAGFLSIRIAGEKAFGHSVTLSVAVFFVAYFALLTGSTNIAAWGGSLVFGAVLLVWFAGIWRSVLLTFCVVLLYFVTAAFSAKKSK